MIVVVREPSRTVERGRESRRYLPEESSMLREKNACSGAYTCTALANE